MRHRTATRLCSAYQYIVEVCSKHYVSTLILQELSCKHLKSQTLKKISDWKHMDLYREKTWQHDRLSLIWLDIRYFHVSSWLPVWRIAFVLLSGWYTDVVMKTKGTIVLPWEIRRKDAALKNQQTYFDASWQQETDRKHPITYIYGAVLHHINQFTFISIINAGSPACLK